MDLTFANISGNENENKECNKPSKSFLHDVFTPREGSEGQEEKVKDALGKEFKVNVYRHGTASKFYMPVAIIPDKRTGLKN